MALLLPSARAWARARAHPRALQLPSCRGSGRTVAPSLAEAAHAGERGEPGDGARERGRADVAREHRQAQELARGAVAVGIRKAPAWSAGASPVGRRRAWSIVRLRRGWKNGAVGELVGRWLVAAPVRQAPHRPVLEGLTDQRSEDDRERERASAAEGGRERDGRRGRGALRRGCDPGTPAPRGLLHARRRGSIHTFVHPSLPLSPGPASAVRAEGRRAFSVRPPPSRSMQPCRAAAPRSPSAGPAEQGNASPRRADHRAAAVAAAAPAVMVRVSVVVAVLLVPRRPQLQHQQHHHHHRRMQREPLVVVVVVVVVERTEARRARRARQGKASKARRARPARQGEGKGRRAWAGWLVVARLRCPNGHSPPTPRSRAAHAMQGQGRENRGGPVKRPVRPSVDGRSVGRSVLHVHGRPASREGRKEGG
eukprot:scaffold1552_cov309-Prasinococcus_capsulatus_cf.AAC.1